MPDEFEAQMDLETINRAREIEKNPGRMDRAKRFAEKKSDEYSAFAGKIPGKPKQSFAGAVRNSRMNK